MIRTAAVLLALASPAAAATVVTWSGPGPNACNTEGDHCSLEWARQQLSVKQQAEFSLARKRNPLPQYLPIYDGDVIPLMAYAKGGVPHMDRRGTLATIDAPESAWGWQMDGWTFVRIDACGNWAVVVTGKAKRLADASLVLAAGTVIPRGGLGSGGGGFGGGGGGAGGGTPPICIVCLPVVIPPVIVPPIEPPPPAPIPLPATGWLLLLALGFLFRKGIMP